jgi:hypothetical protein
VININSFDNDIFEKIALRLACYKKFTNNLRRFKLQGIHQAFSFRGNQGHVHHELNIFEKIAAQASRLGHYHKRLTIT